MKNPLELIGSAFPQSRKAQVLLGSIVGVSVVLNQPQIALASVFVATGARAWLNWRNNDLDEECVPAEQLKNITGDINDAVTARLRAATGDTELTAIESRSAQYRLLMVANDDSAQVAKALPRVASVLGVAPDALGWIPTAGRDLSIILAPLERTEWLPVAFDESALTPGKLIGYVGRDVLGNHVTYSRQDAPHALISGTTRSGKTEAIRADLQSMRLSGLKPEIHIIDAKGTLCREQCTSFTADMEEGLATLQSIVERARERIREIVAAGCDNWFQYKARLPDACPSPIMVYMLIRPQPLQRRPCQAPAVVGTHPYKP